MRSIDHDLQRLPYQRRRVLEVLEKALLHSQQRCINILPQRQRHQRQGERVHTSRERRAHPGRGVRQEEARIPNPDPRADVPHQCGEQRAAGEVGGGAQPGAGGAAPPAPGHKGGRAGL